MSFTTSEKPNNEESDFSLRPHLRVRWLVTVQLLCDKGSGWFYNRSTELENQQFHFPNQNPVWASDYARSSPFHRTLIDWLITYFKHMYICIQNKAYIQEGKYCPLVQRVLEKEWEEVTIMAAHHLYIFIAESCSCAAASWVYLIHCMTIITNLILILVTRFEKHSLTFNNGTESTVVWGRKVNKRTVHIKDKIHHVASCLEVWLYMRICWLKCKWNVNVWNVFTVL